MKRLAMAALAAATFAAPLAVSTEAAAQHRGDHRRDRDRDWDRDGRRDRDWDDRRDNRRSYREGRRDQRHWDRSRYNGYTYRGQWYYGPPPVAYRDYADYGYRSWRRGDRLPRYYRDNYHAVDWRYHRLRQPPRGYHYVRDDRGDYLLVGIATGVILGVILAGN
ncbi:MAG: RcnB family protein [Hyphomonadaceae bacterium]